MAVTQQIIEIVTVMKNLAAAPLKQLTNQTKALTNQQQQIKEFSEESGISTKKLNRAFNDMNLTVDDSGTIINKFTGEMQEQGKTLDKVTRQTRKFSFEWLGVMFLGMAIFRVFGGIVKKTLEMVGISELLTEALKLSVFTALSPFLDLLFGISSAFFDLDPAIQGAIGWFIIIAAAVGGFLLVFGQMMLGLQALGVVMPALSIGLGSFILILGLVVVAIVAIIAIVIAFRRAWKENFLGIRESVKKMIDGFKQMFSGLFNFIAGAVKTFKSLITLDFEGLIEGIEQMWNGFKDFWEGLWNGLLGTVETATKTITKLITDVVGISGEGKVSKVAKGVRSSFGLAGILSEIFSTSVGDAIIRPNGQIIRTDPADTLIATKTPGALGGGGVSLNQTINLNAGSNDEMVRLIKENNNRLVEDVRRLIKD